MPERHADGHIILTKDYLNGGKETFVSRPNYENLSPKQWPLVLWEDPLFKLGVKAANVLTFAQDEQPRAHNPPIPCPMCDKDGSVSTFAKKAWAAAAA